MIEWGKYLMGELTTNTHTHSHKPVIVLLIDSLNITILFAIIKTYIFIVNTFFLIFSIGYISNMTSLMSYGYLQKNLANFAFANFNLGLSEVYKLRK